jgi:hypothetical protein
MWPGSSPSTAPAKLAMLFGACSSVAISIYGLVVFRLRRRSRRGCGRPNDLVFRHGQPHLTNFASSRS